MWAASSPSADLILQCNAAPAEKRSLSARLARSAMDFNLLGAPGGEIPTRHTGEPGTALLSPTGAGVSPSKYEHVKRCTSRTVKSPQAQNVGVEVKMYNMLLASGVPFFSGPSCPALFYSSMLLKKSRVSACVRTHARSRHALTRAELMVDWGCTNWLLFQRGKLLPFKKYLVDFIPSTIYHP